MHAYRDQYAQLFHDGRNVILIAISVDPADTLAAWARHDDVRGRGRLVAPHRRAPRVEQYGERQRVLREMTLDRSRRLVHPDADGEEPHCAAVARVGRLERRLERLAQRTPRRPELEHHR